jgi:hypothetical protein
MRGIWGALIAVALCGAAQAQAFAPVEQKGPHIRAAETGDYSAIHRIAIVSTMGSQLRIEGRKGSTRIDVSDWKVDDAVTATLRKYLGGHFEIAQGDVDARVIVKPVGDPLPGPAGIGVRLDEPLAFCANFEIDIVGARDGVVLGRAVSRMQTHTATPASFACYAEDASLRSELEHGPSAATLDGLEAQFKVLLPRALVETLRSLKLGLALPPPGDHSIAPPENPLDTQAIASVAVVSAMGDTFAFSRPRDVLHEGELIETPITAWGLDAEVERIATAALARKFAVKPADFDRAALARVVLREGKRPKIEGLKPSAEVDVYVLIVKAFRNGTGSSGAGLWRREWIGDATYACVNYAVLVVDARTLKVLRAALPAMPPQAASAYPLVRVDDALWPDLAKDARSAEGAHAIVERLLTDSLPETLYQIGLTWDRP